MIAKMQGKENANDLQLFYKMIAGIVSGMLCWLPAFPFVSKIIIFSSREMYLCLNFDCRI